MKKAASYFILLSCFISCNENSQQADDAIPGKPIIFKEVDADVSDIDVRRAYGFDINVDGTFDYEENYYYSLNGIVSLAFPFYKATYKAGSFPLMAPKVHNSLMCRTHDCDSSGMMMSGVWYRYDKNPGKPSFKWKLITTDTNNGYEIIINQLPEEVPNVKIPRSLSTTSDNMVEFEYSGSDSLLLGLLSIPKKNLDGMTTGTISTQKHFNVRAQGNRFIIPGEMVDQASVQPSDTAFVNLISMKRVFKVIEGKKIAINYRKNHFYPVTIN